MVLKINSLLNCKNKCSHFYTYLLFYNFLKYCRSKEGKQDGERKVGGDIVLVCPPPCTPTLRPTSLRVLQQT